MPLYARGIRGPSRARARKGHRCSYTPNYSLRGGDQCSYTPNYSLGGGVGTTFFVHTRPRFSPNFLIAAFFFGSQSVFFGTLLGRFWGRPNGVLGRPARGRWVPSYTPKYRLARGRGARIPLNIASPGVRRVFLVTR